MEVGISTFLLALLLSFGVVIGADDVGKSLSAVINEQPPSVQQQLGFLGDPNTDRLLNSIVTSETVSAFNDIQQRFEDLAAYINGDEVVVGLDTIQSSVGIDNWKRLLEELGQNSSDLPHGERQNFIQTEDFIIEYGVETDFSSSFISCSAYYSVIDINTLSVIKRDTIHALGIGAPDTEENKAFINAIADEWTENFIYLPNNFCLVFGVCREHSITQTIDLSVYLSAAENIITSDDTVPLPIVGAIVGDIASEIGQELVINPDGTVTLPDGTVINQNADGTYTINNNTYSPTYYINKTDDEALLRLLYLLLAKIDALDFENTDVSETQEYTGTLSEFIYQDAAWMTVFPFCIPWDLVRGVKLLSATPAAPVFEIPFDIPAFGLFSGYSTVISLNFGQYEQYFVPVRWFTTVFFLAGLCFITFKIVKGAR